MKIKRKTNKEKPIKLDFRIHPLAFFVYKSSETLPKSHKTWADEPGKSQLVGLELRSSFPGGPVGHAVKSN